MTALTPLSPSRSEDPNRTDRREGGRRRADRAAVLAPALSPSLPATVLFAARALGQCETPITTIGAYADAGAPAGRPSSTAKLDV